MLFSKKAVGLDIADNTIEIAEVKGSGVGVKVLNLSRISLEPGIVERGRIKDEGKLVEAINKVFKEAKPKTITDRKVIFGLPESQVFLHNFILEPHSKKERRNLIENEIKTSIPIEESDLVYEFRVLRDDKKGVEVLVAGASKEVVREWLLFFKKAKIEVEVLDIEILASWRDLFQTLPKEPVCIVDIGASTSYLAIFDKDGLHHEQIISKAGNNFTANVATAAKLDEKKAETEKIKNGLKSKNKKVVEVLQKELDSIVKEVQISLDYFKKKTGSEVQKIVLIGGSSQMKGLDKYFEENLKLPVQIGSSKSANEKVPLEYIESIGLAMRGINNKWNDKDPAIPMIRGLKVDQPKVIKKEIEKDPGLEEGGELEEDDESEESTDEDPKSPRKLLIILLAVVIVGGGFIGFMSWQRSNEKNKEQEAIKLQLENIPEIEYIEPIVEEGVVSSTNNIVTTTDTNTTNSTTVTNLTSNIEEIII